MKHHLHHLTPSCQPVSRPKSDAPLLILVAVVVGLCIRGVFAVTGDISRAIYNADVAQARFSK
jgi:hypothetical protein